MQPVLYVGNRNYSSWSLRPWLCLKWAAIAFDERFIELDQPGYGAEGIEEIKRISPAGRVPVLMVDGHAIWDSLAIAEWAAEQPDAKLLPDAWKCRARARSLAAEMHSGFPALRNELPANIRRRCKATGLSAEAQRDIARIDHMWAAREGSYICGARSIADAFYLPVATRFRTYNIVLSPQAAAYCNLMLSDPAFVEWEAKVLAEPERHFQRAPIDSLYR